MYVIQYGQWKRLRGSTHDTEVGGKAEPLFLSDAEVGARFRLVGVTLRELLHDRLIVFVCGGVG